jgi:hypothetical protein
MMQLRLPFSVRTAERRNPVLTKSDNLSLLPLSDLGLVDLLRRWSAVY